MKRIFTLLMSAFLCTMVMGQTPTVHIKKATTTPIIDGIVDDVWATADENAIAVPMTVLGVAENPTVGNSWWKMLWDEKGIYVLCFVDDDVFMPAYKGDTPANSWMYDKVELYFDANYLKKQGLGGDNNGKGLYQFAPTEYEPYVNGGRDSVETNGFAWAFNATTDPTYYIEYFIPYTALLDNAGIMVDVTEPIAFDVSIQDNDIVIQKRDRMDWVNAGVLAESHTNMDDSGLIILDGAELPVQIVSVAITGGTITSDNGTFQMVPVIVPADAPITQMNWTITSGIGNATISAAGVVTAIKDGTIGVRAAATDGGMAESNEATITISGQIKQLDEVNFVLDGKFDLAVGKVPSSVWQGGAVIVNGVAEMTNPTVKVDPEIPNPWDWCLTQYTLVPFAEKDLNYIFSFVAYSDAERPLTIDFEDPYLDHYNRYGISTDATAAGTSDWTVTLTTQPVKYVQHVTFTNMIPETIQKMNFMLGMATPKVYLDSVILVTEENYILSSKDLKANVNAMKVYPNPVGNGTSLFVELASAKTNVAIYNAVGQKLMEKVSTGSRVQFNVSSLQKGLYFVKLSDGTTQKFIK